MASTRIQNPDAESDKRPDHVVDVCDQSGVRRTKVGSIKRPCWSFRPGVPSCMNVNTESLV